MADVVRGAPVLAALSWRADRRGCVALLLLSGVMTLNVVAISLALRAFVVAATGRHATAAVVAGVVVAVLATVMLGAGRALFWLRLRVDERTALRLDDELMRLVTSPEDVARLDRPEYARHLELLRTDRLALSQAGSAVFGTLTVAVQLLVTAVVLVLLDPRLAALAVFAAPAAWTQSRGEAGVERALRASADHRRLARELFALGTAPAAAKEVRVFGVGDALRRRHRATWDAFNRPMRRARRRAALLAAAGSGLFALAYLAGLLLLLDTTRGGGAAAGDAVLAVTLVAQLRGQATGAVRAGVVFNRAARAAARLTWLRDASAPARRGAAPAPDLLATGIALRDVSFRYEGASRDVLAGVTLTLPAGGTVAVVGENGAGKSTLVKLLCGLHEPTAGSIEVDGVPLADLAPGAWWSRVAVEFDDFLRPLLTAGRAIGIGDVARADDEDAVGAAARLAGATGLLDALPNGAATQLGAGFPGGRDLSGGQWQSVALARASMRRTPLLRVLDEPGASMDPKAEQEVFERMMRATPAGAVTVLVSHRFATVHMADLIVVLGEGTVAESGTHAQLVARGGWYARMYALQAAAYA